MYQVDDEPMEEPIETIHLYVVREGQNRPSLVPVPISILTLSFLIAIGVFTPYHQPETRALIRVPAVLLPLKTLTTTVSVIPTGVKTYPATQAHGTLTITNGSIITQELPQGMTFTGKDGVEVITDQAVFVPAGSAQGYGRATVTAHAAVSGTGGNIPALAIDRVEGTSLYIRNLTAFTGGRDAYTVPVQTPQDRSRAIAQARQVLVQRTVSGLLAAPCKEAITGTTTLYVSWTCQFVSYEKPAGKVLSVRVQGNTVYVEVLFVVRPRLFHGK